MLHISCTAALLGQRPYYTNNVIRKPLPRKSLECPPDQGRFIRPLKQCFVRNPRLMPMTRITLSLLAGWAGHGGSLQTTIGIIARHLGRSRRQVFRYLRDAAEEGYLFYSKTKDRIGRYTGISIRLNFAAIRHEKQSPRPKPARTVEVTSESETKARISISLPNEEAFQQRLAAICRRNGIDPPSSG